MKGQKEIAAMTAPVQVAVWRTLKDRQPIHALVNQTDLVIIRYNEQISVLYGRCHHRGALLADGFIEGDNLICGVHFWDYRFDSGVSEYNHEEQLHKFPAAVFEGKVFIDKADILAFEQQNPAPFKRDKYLGSYADTHPVDAEPYNIYIRDLAQNGLSKYGHHGPMVAMGVDRNLLPKWESIQFLPAQLSQKPLLDDASVKTAVIIGPDAQKPLKLDMPVFVSDMSFGALSKEAKLALAKGAEMAGTGICSGEGGMLAGEQASNTKYFYELASAKFGFSWEKVQQCQAFHFKGGQGAKVGTGGHLPGAKVTADIAAVRGLKPGQDAISPATFPDLRSIDDFKQFADEVRAKTGGIPIGFKLAASHIEEDIDFALASGADYIIIDGRGGGTGATPSILRDNICVPTIAALARARAYLDQQKSNATLIITGGLRVAEDFAKAMMMGADAIAVSNAALQAIGCIAMRACNTNNCPVGIATQKTHLRARLQIDKSAQQLFNYFDATNQLLQVIARACGYHSLSDFNQNDLSTFDWNMHLLTGIKYAGIGNSNFENYDSKA